MSDLRNHTALITGAAQGIGFGIAMALARAGSRVIIADLSSDKACSAAARIEDTGQEALALAVDVTDEASVRACVAAAIESRGRIDILVNNAGVHCEKIGQLSNVEHFKKCFDVNLLGIWRMTQGLVPHFKAHGGGKIVNIASVNGRKPWADTPAYSASKAAALNLTQALAIALAPDNINVNAVCPGGVMTAMADAFTPDRPDIGEQIIQARLLKRALVPEDIGYAVAFFASPNARNITGQSLNVDGGYVLS